MTTEYSAAQGIKTHPQLQSIIQAALDGQSCRSIAKSTNPPISHATISTYIRTVVKPALKEARKLTPISTPNKMTTGVVAPEYEHKAEIERITTTALVTAPILSIFRQRLEALHGRIDASLDKVAADDTLLPLASGLFGQAHKNLEILGKATGELTDAQPGVAIQIVCPAGARVDLAGGPAVTYDAYECDEIVPRR